MTLQSVHTAVRCHRGFSRHKSSIVLPHSASFSSSASRSFRATQLRARDNFVSRRFPSLFVSDPRYPKVDVGLFHKLGSPGGADLSSLRPPPLDFVDPPKKDERGNVSLAERGKYWFRWGKSLVKFYKAGLYKVWSNYQELRALRNRLGSSSRNPWYIDHCALYGGDETVVDSSGKPFRAITRQEYQLWHRARHDIFKLVPFALILMICGEFTPLFILATGTWMLPSTCRRPADQKSDLRALCKRFDYFIKTKKDRFEVAADNYEARWNAPQNSQVFRRLLNWSYVLTGNPIYRWSREVPWKTFITNMTWGSRRMSTRYNQILCDTILIMREGGFANLSAEDIYEYCLFCASPNFLRIAKQALANGVNPANEAMRKTMVPILDRNAKELLDVDWTRLAPRNAWPLEMVNRVMNVASPDSCVNVALGNLLKELPPTK